MADNVVVQQPSAAGDTFRTKEKTSVHTPVSIIDVGGSGAEALLSSANPMPIGAPPSLPLPSGASTEATSASILAKIIAAPATEAKQLPDGHNVAVSSSALPTGAATAANQTTIIGHVDGLEGLLTTIDTDTGAIATSVASIDTKTPALGQALAAASVPVVLTAAQLTTLTPLATVAATQSGSWTVTANAGTGTFAISAAALPLPTGASTLAEQQSQTTHLASLASKAVDFDTGGGTDTVVSFGILLPASGGAVVGGTSTNPIRTDPTGTTTQPVSAASLPLPTGASTLGEQQTQTTSLASIATNTGNSATSLNVLDDWDETDRAKVNIIVGQAGVSANTGTVDAATQRVVLATDVALPTGTNSIGQVTANAGTNLNTSALALEAGGNLAAAATSLATLDNCIAGNEAQVDVITLPSIPAGTNNIGDVDVLTLPSIPAGTNNIGDVDIATIAAGDNNIGNVDIVTVPTDPFGANADSASATGSISAKLRFIAATGIPITSIAAGDNNIGNVDIASALPAGTNAIGKLSANSGVDIGDVDVTSISAGSNLIGDVGIQGRTTGGLSIFRSIDLDESEEEVKATAGTIYGLVAINLKATPLYLKLYNATAANVTVGTTTPVITIPIPSAGATTGAGFVFNIPQGIAFGTAISAAVTTGVADNDTGAPGGNEAVVQIFYK